MRNRIKATFNVKSTMDPNLSVKLEKLKSIIRSYQSAIVAFSGGVDSTLLAYMTKEVLERNVLLVTAISPTYPLYESEGANSVAEYLSITHRVIVLDELDIPGFSNNPPDRCYYCKAELFAQIKRIAEEEQYEAVFDGSNAEDMHDFRPGRKALDESGVISPLYDAGLKKEEIRKLSRMFGLPTADKPAYACLASRFPYGEKITREKLARFDAAEKMIRDLGFSQYRVRSHGDLARIELLPSEMLKGWQERDSIVGICRRAGFVFVAMVLQGYRTGAMNEALSPNEVAEGKTR